MPTLDPEEAPVLGDIGAYSTSVNFRGMEMTPRGFQSLWDYYTLRIPFTYVRFDFGMKTRSIPIVFSDGSLGFPKHPIRWGGSTWNGDGGHHLGDLLGSFRPKLHELSVVLPFYLY